MGQRRVRRNVETGKPARLPQRPPRSLIVIRKEDMVSEVEAVPNFSDDRERYIQRDSAPECEGERVSGDGARAPLPSSRK